MDVIFSNVAGLDVHKKTIVACVRMQQPQGKVVEQVETFATMTSDLLRLLDWLCQQQVTHVAIEATGVLWKPIWNVLEGHFQLVLVNPHQTKRMPGRKSDVSDSQWLAQLLACGLLQSSFVAPREQRQLRDLTRHRAQLVSERTRVANRIHKTLDDANVKLACVASDILGASGRAMLQALLAGERDPARLAELAKGALRNKIPQLQEALVGCLSEHHCFLLQHLLSHYDYLEGQIEAFSQRIEEALRPFVDEEQVARLDQVPGVNRRTIENVIAEIGSDMDRFPDEHHLSSWAGMSPGNEESAGKRLRQKTTKGNRWLRRALAEAAWAASHCKNSYLASQYKRIARRRGKKRALVAVGHSLLVIFYFMLKAPIDYEDLGKDYFEKLKPEQCRRYLVKRLQSLGYEVTLTPKETTAKETPAA